MEQLNMISLNLPKNITLKVSEEEFEKLAIANQDLRLERKYDGELIVMPPTGGDTGNSNIEIAYQLQGWSRTNKLGKAFDSSTGFRLPKGGTRSPDASWVSNKQWNSLTAEQQKKFPPICPLFAVELKSPSDNLKTIQDKMSEYLDNGLLLGWLIDPITKRVEIYRQGDETEILDNPTSVSGENVLPGFNLDLTKIW